MFYVITEENINLKNIFFKELDLKNEKEINLYKKDLISLFNEMSDEMTRIENIQFGSHIDEKEFSEELKYFIKNDYLLILMLDNDKPIGYSIFHPMQNYKNNLIMSELLIIKEYRKQGIANMFFKFIKKHMKLKKYKMIELRVNKNNTDAIKAYENNGFMLRSYNMTLSL